jgi:uncharacterized protein YuzE
MAEAAELKIQFDPKNDVLYCSLGEPRESIGVETEDDVIVRYDPDTDAVVGFTMLNFSQRFTRNPMPVSVPLTKALNTI